MQIPSLETGGDVKPSSPTSASARSQPFGQSTQQSLHQGSSEPTLYSADEQVQALPSLLTKAALLEHSLQQQLAFFKAHNLQSPSEGAYVASLAPERSQYIHKRRRTISGYPYPDRPTSTPALGIKQSRSPRRTSSLDRGRDIYRNSLLPNTPYVPLPQHPLELQEDQFVAEADAQETASLWREVATMSGRQSFLPKPTNSESAPSRASGSTNKVKIPSPYDKDFIQRVLEPRSIRISRPYSLKVHRHFDAEEPIGHRVRHYTEERKAPASSVWLECGDSFVADIVKEYGCMSQRGLCEAEFASYARETIFKRESRIEDTTVDSRRWKTERLIELVCKTTSYLWQCPPLVGREYARMENKSFMDYDFDLRPDCSYWLSLQAFSPEYKVHVQEHTLVMYDTITCPYLTVEFKKDGSGDQAAFNQVAGAAAIALYNRFLLRKESLELAKQKWDPQHVKALKHYGITFIGPLYNVWCIQAVLTSRYCWSGCHMERVFLGDCRHAKSVRDLIDWVNEIHCWGLTIHGPECQKDIKLSIRATESSSGIRVSDTVPFVTKHDLEPEP